MSIFFWKKKKSETEQETAAEPAEQTPVELLQRKRLRRKCLQRKLLRRKRLQMRLLRRKRLQRRLLRKKRLQRRLLISGRPVCSSL